MVPPAIEWKVREGEQGLTGGAERGGRCEVGKPHLDKDKEGGRRARS